MSYQRVQEPAARAQGRAQAALAVALVVVLLAGLVTVWSRSRSGRGEPRAWDRRVADIARFVEQQRGLTFHHPVSVEFMSDSVFTKKLVGHARPTAKEKRELQQVLESLRALGLVQGQVDLDAAGRKLVDQSVLGFYSDDDHRVFVRGSSLSPDGRVTLAHELTHALQYQRFDMNRLHDKSSQTQTAFRALVEADAIRIQEAYAKTLSPGDARAYQATQDQQSKQARDTGGIPDALVEGLSFPYVFGPTFLDVVMGSGGNAAVDHAFRHPPASEAQIVDPLSYLAGVKVVKVKTPHLDRGQKRIGEPDDVGQVSMLTVLGNRLDFKQAWPAVKPWAGDAGVTYRERGTTCVAVATALRTVPDAQRFELATRGWASTMPKGSVSRGGVTVELRSCDPGKNAVARDVPQPPAFHVLELRSGLIQTLHKDAGADYGLATCAADGLIATVGPGALLSLEAANPPPGDPRVAQLQETAARVGRACRNGETFG